MDVETKIYYQSNQLTPRVQIWYYWGNGLKERMFHRLDGPARITYDDDGETIYSVEWFIRGFKIEINEWAEYSSCTREEIIEYKLKYG